MASALVSATATSLIPNNVDIVVVSGIGSVLSVLCHSDHFPRDLSRVQAALPILKDFFKVSVLAAPYVEEARSKMSHVAGPYVEQLREAIQQATDATVMDPIQKPLSLCVKLLILQFSPLFKTFNKWSIRTSWFRSRKSKIV